jgi:hypothetical protein
MEISEKYKALVDRIPPRKEERIFQMNFDRHVKEAVGVIVAAIERSQTKVLYLCHTNDNFMQMLGEHVVLIFAEKGWELKFHLDDNEIMFTWTSETK